MMESPSAAQQRIGSVQLGSFRLLSLLGAGAFGSAYLAEQTGTERRSVVKIAHRQLLDVANIDIRRSFAKEFRAATRVNHPSLVTIYTAGETSDHLPAIAMEYIDGERLEEVINRRAPLSGELLSIFQQLASAIVLMQQNRMIHRDISPRNVILTRDHLGAARAILLDFGLTLLTPGGGAPRRSGSTSGLVGTSNYTAPEQLAGQALPASDVYSLGALLWRSLVGWPIADDLSGRRLEPLVARNPAIDEELAALMYALVDPEPSSRPSAVAFMEVWPELAARYDDRFEALCATTRRPPLRSAVSRRAPGSDPRSLPSAEVGCGGRPVTRSFGSQPQPAVSAVPVSQVSPSARAFVGAMPELIATLDAHLREGDDSAALQICSEMARRCRDLDVPQFERVVVMLGGLLMAKELVDPKPLVEEIEQEYGHAFRRLMNR